MRIYFVWLHNKTDCRDDDVLKIGVRSKGQATRIAHQMAQSNFSVGRTFTRQEFKKYDPEWHSLQWGHKADNE
jgi:hypothetical protein